MFLTCGAGIQRVAIVAGSGFAARKGLAEGDDLYNLLTRAGRTDTIR
jgi:hypothetical protein